MGFLRKLVSKKQPGADTLEASTESEGAARRERLRAVLPPLDEKYLHTDVTTLGTRVGPGREQFVEGAEEYKKGHWETACRLLKEAISLELTMPYESSAHRALGTIYINLGDLQLSVEHYLKCLEVPVRDEEALRDSINVLSLIYRLAGRERDAESLRELAEKTIGQRNKIEPELERQLIEVIKAFVG